MEDELDAASTGQNIQFLNGGLWFKYRRFWQWIILSFSALNVVFLGGKRRAFGIFVAKLHNGEFNETSLAELNWIGDSYAALGYLTVGLSTWFILWTGRRYKISQALGGILILFACISSAYVNSVHWLFFTHTILHGAGSSLILATVGLIVAEYFPKDHRHHVLATTLVSGGSLASVVFVELYAILIDAWGWRGAFIILGVVYFIVTWSAALVFCRRPNASSTNMRSRSSISIKIFMRHLRNIGYVRFLLIILWLFDRILTSIVTYGMLLNLTDYLRRFSTNLTSSSLLTALFAAGEAVTYIFGALLSAITKNKMKDKLRYILLISTLCMSLCLFLWERASNNNNEDDNMKMTIHTLSNGTSVINPVKPSSEIMSRSVTCEILAFLSGLFLGPSITFLYPAGEEMTQLPSDAAYPVTLAGMGIGMLLSPVLSAMIAQKFKYKWFFVVQGILILIKFICLLCGILILWLCNKGPNTVVGSSIRGGSISNQGDEESLLESDQLAMRMKRDDSSFLPLPQTQFMEEELIDDDKSPCEVTGGIGWDRIDLDEVEDSSRESFLDNQLQTRI